MRCIHRVASLVDRNKSGLSSSCTISADGPHRSRDFPDGLGPPSNRGSLGVLLDERAWEFLHRPITNDPRCYGWRIPRLEPTSRRIESRGLTSISRIHQKSNPVVSKARDGANGVVHQITSDDRKSLWTSSLDTLNITPGFAPSSFLIPPSFSQTAIPFTCLPHSGPFLSGDLTY